MAPEASTRRSFTQSLSERAQLSPQRLLDIVFGYDYFISYSHHDGLNYPRQLSERLKASGFSVFLDKEVYGGGDDLSAATRRRVRMSTYLVVVARDAAMNQSRWVVEEVRECLAAKRTPIVIDLNNAFEKAPGERPLKALLANRLFIDEDPPVEGTASYDGEPSDSVIEELRRGFKAMRRNTLRLRIMTLVAVVLAGLAIASLWLYFRADAQRLAALASRLDTQATQHFSQARTLDVRTEIESERYVKLLREYETLKTESETAHTESLAQRLRVLGDEVSQYQQRIGSLREDARRLRNVGKQDLQTADAQWSSLKSKWFFGSQQERARPAPPTIFTIEVLNAPKGESLILHYGEIDNPRFILIDAGSVKVFRDQLAPRLADLRARWSNNQPLKLDMIIVSQSDYERIEGINQLTDAMLGKGDSPNPFLEIGAVWFNHFIPITKELAQYHNHERPGKWRLAGNLLSLNVPVNVPFQDFVLRPEQGAVKIEVAGGLAITVLNPTPRWISEYQKLSLRTWERNDLPVKMVPPSEKNYSGKEIIRIPSPGEKSYPPLPDETLRERSVVNLASLVLLFEFGEPNQRKRFLYTGDARADQILEGLHEAGYLDSSGKFEVDVLHIPHYGSDQNVSEGFFTRVLARNYIITGDGTHHNPEPTTMNMIVNARQNDQYVFQFAHRIGFTEVKDPAAESDSSDLATLLDRLFVEGPAAGRKYERVFRPPDDSSLLINLLEPVRY